MRLGGGLAAIWHTQQTLTRWCRIRSYLDSAVNNGLIALDAITTALSGEPWLHQSLWHSLQVIFWGFFFSSVVVVILFLPAFSCSLWIFNLMAFMLMGMVFPQSQTTALVRQLEHFALADRDSAGAGWHVARFTWSWYSSHFLHLSCMVDKPSKSFGETTTWNSPRA